MANPASPDTSNDLVLLFTSAPADRLRYTIDFLTCLASPDQHRVTFSYKREWLSDAVFHAKDLVGKNALVIFCEHVVATRATTFVPLRWARITEFGPPALLEDGVARDDTPIAVTFKLDRFVHATPNAHDDVVIAATSALLALPVRPFAPASRDQNGGPVKNDRWVVFADHSITSRDVACETGETVPAKTAWLAHAGHLSKCDSLKEALIFRVTRPQYLGWDRQTKSASIKQDRLLGDTYKLRASKQYKLVVSFFHSGTSDADPKSLVQATVSSEKVRRTAPISAAQGQETVATIFFGSEPLAADELATVTVEAQRDSNQPPAPLTLKSPTVAFIVRFRPRWPTIVIGTSMVLLGILINGLSKADWKELSLHVSTGHLLVIKVVGAVSAAIGALLAFRRGPSGG